MRDKTSQWRRAKYKGLVSHTPGIGKPEVSYQEIARSREKNEVIGVHSWAKAKSDVFELEHRGLGGWGRVIEWEPRRVFC